jgi:23S rRNA U2552 (ribose-2'-O)-methylase RlmE/FtsJ
VARNVTTLQGDFLSPAIQAELEHVITAAAASRQKQGVTSSHQTETETSSGGAASRVDTILSDMMANMSGIRVRDIEASLELCQTALSFAQGRLKTGLTKQIEADVEEKKALSMKDYKGCML